MEFLGGKKGVKVDQKMGGFLGSKKGSKFGQKTGVFFGQKIGGIFGSKMVDFWRFFGGWPKTWVFGQKWGVFG